MSAPVITITNAQPIIILPDNTPDVDIDIGSGVGSPGPALYKNLRTDYGAGGVGGNDTAKIAAAIADLSGGTGSWYDTTGAAKTLYIPAGEYGWDSDLDPFPPFVDIVTDGMGAVVFKALGPNARLSFSDRGLSGYRAGRRGGFVVDGANVAGAAAGLVYFGRQSEISYHDINIVNSAGVGALFEEAQNLRLLNFGSQMNASHGVMLDYGTGGLKFLGVEMGSNGGYNVYAPGLHGYAGGTSEIQSNTFAHFIFERSVASSLGMVYIGQSTGFSFIDGTWADTTPLADITFITIRVDRPKVVPSPPGDAGLVNQHITFDGLNYFHGHIGHSTWLDVSGSVTLYFVGASVVAQMKQGIVYDIANGQPFFAANGYISDIEDTAQVATPLVDHSGTGTNIDALFRVQRNRSRTMIRYGTNRTYDQWFVHGDAQPQFRLRTSGKVELGPGGSTAPDVNLYRGAADELTSDDRIYGIDGLTTKTGTAAPDDSLFAHPPPNGTLYIRTSTSELCYRVGVNVWACAAVSVTPAGDVYGRRVYGSGEYGH